MTCDMLEPCKCPSLDSCQKRFLWTHNEADRALHPVIGLVLQVGDAEKFPYAFGFESLDLIFRVSNQGPVSADTNTCSCRRSSSMFLMSQSLFCIRKFVTDLQLLVS